MMEMAKRNMYYGCIVPRHELPDVEDDRAMNADCYCALEDELDNGRCLVIESWWSSMQRGVYSSIELRQMLHAAVMFIEAGLFNASEEIFWLKEIIETGVYDE